VVSFLYSSVGHGGASGYLALMILFDFSPEKMKSTALLLNLFVAAVSFYHFYKEGYFNSRLFWLFAIASIPFAFLGGFLTIDFFYYKKILGFLLIFAVCRILVSNNLTQKKTRDLKTWHGLIIGSIIGFFSGLIGIGGGIILTPIILIMNYGGIKEAAAVSALFIFVNSAAGIFGQFSSGVIYESKLLYLVFLSLIGGFFGSYFGSKKLNNSFLRFLLGVVLLVASFKLFIV
jgi:uncharacterized protein